MKDTNKEVAEIVASLTETFCPISRKCPFDESKLCCFDCPDHINHRCSTKCPAIQEGKIKEQEECWIYKSALLLSSKEQLPELPGSRRKLKVWRT